MTPQQLAGIKSGEVRRLKTVALKNDFIRAVTYGASLTHNGVVSRHTYQKWRKADADFNAWLASHIKRMRREAAERKEAWRKAYDAVRDRNRDYKAQLKYNREWKRGKRDERQKFYESSALDGLYEVDVFAKANKLVSRNLPQDIRESAISELVLMMLEGHEPDVKQALRTARGEISYNMVEFDETNHS